MKKVPPERIEDALAYYAAGKSSRECEKLTHVNYRTLQNIANARGIEKGSLSHLIEMKAQVDAEILPLSTQQLKVVEKEAAIRQRQIEFFNEAAIRNVAEAMNAACESQNDYKARAETIVKGKETVIGKTPDVAVQVNNNVTLEELLKDL